MTTMSSKEFKRALFIVQCGFFVVVLSSHTANAFLPTRAVIHRQNYNPLQLENRCDNFGRQNARSPLVPHHSSAASPIFSLIKFPWMAMISGRVFVISFLVLAPFLLLSPARADAISEESPREKYFQTMLNAPRDERVAANEAIMDFAVGTINTMYYDNTGGVRFQPREFYGKWKALRDVAHGAKTPVRSRVKSEARDTLPSSSTLVPKFNLETRNGAIQGLKWIVGQLDDPFSLYLTREELREELKPTGKDGFLGLGAIVEPATADTRREPTLLFFPSTDPHFLSAARVINLPIISAVTPDSPCERAGLTVGDRIVAIGTNSFLGSTRDHVSWTLKNTYSAENYIGHPELTIAKPIWKTIEFEQQPLDVIVGYRQSRIRLPTKLVEPFSPENGDDIVHYDLLSDSILSKNNKVGYIRMTRFSRRSTAGYLQAVQALEDEGAQSYIIDLRNNYGGVIQEAMLTASTLLRDPHAVICYIMNSRGGFTPHDVEEYIVDKRYPGYFLSKESKTVALDQVKRESPYMFVNNGIDWVPPSSFASLHEQRMKRGIHIGSNDQYFVAHQARMTQKKIVLLINEGTASSAEVFAAALHDNGRTVATVGTKTFGKGLIQHTFPMPDGGGLRLTVAEYLTPALSHVTKIGNAGFDSHTGAWVGGGIQPDVLCDSQQGIPGKSGADLCVGIALDVLREATNGEDVVHRDGVGEYASLSKDSY